MKHRIIVDIGFTKGLSDKAQEDVAATIFGMINDFSAVVKASIAVGLESTMFSTPEAPIVAAKDACVHAFEVVAQNTGHDAFVKCIKCSSRYKLDDVIPEGSHEHELNIDVETGDIMCNRCNDTFTLDVESASSACPHTFIVDLEKNLVECQECGAVYAVDAVGDIDIVVDCEPETKGGDVATIDKPIQRKADAPPYEDSLVE